MNFNTIYNAYLGAKNDMLEIRLMGLITYPFLLNKLQSFSNEYDNEDI